jgi:hypothetical protein
MVFEPNVPYDGKFTFARIEYTVYGRSGWEYDYPTMERNLMTVVEDITSIRPHTKGSNIHRFDDPGLLRYPVAYLSEPGYSPGLRCVLSHQVARYVLSAQSQPEGPVLGDLRGQ